VKAAVCRRFGAQLVIEDVGLAPPGPGEVGVRVAACAICHSDITYMEGGWGGELPAVYGHEAAGVVTAIGPGVDGLRPGDHVVVTLVRACGGCPCCVSGHPVLCEAEFRLDRESPIRAADGRPLHQGLRTGAFAEAVTVHASQVVAIPKDAPLASASLLACGVITGVGAVTRTAAIPAGADVAVVGTGGVGLNCIQGAALSGARRIIALDLADAKLEAARRFGATHTVNPGRGDAAKQVRALTGGRGVEFVFVAVGAGAAIEGALDYLRPGGALVIVGMPPYDVVTRFGPTDLASAGQRILGSKMGSARIRIDIPALVDLYRQGRLKLDELITARYPLEDINEAVDAVRRGEALRNVLVFPAVEAAP
jgi:Zn-dependent alcohol dehydrogenase